MLTVLAQLAIVTADLVAAFLFLFGLKRMSSPVTAPSGIAYAGIGMVVAVVASFLYALSVAPAALPHLLVNAGLAVAALAIGGGLAWRSGQRAALTAMPQMVALLNGAGGGAAAAIAAIVLLGGVTAPAAIVLTLAGALIGSVSLSGSLIAWGKLDGLLKHPLRFPAQQSGQWSSFSADPDHRWLCRRHPAHRRGADPAAGHADCGLLRPVAAFRHPDDPANRRGRHAGRDLGLQRFHWAGRGAGRLQSAKPGPDDRGHGGRCRRPDADTSDGQGDEPLGQQYPVHQLRRHQGA